MSKYRRIFPFVTAGLCVVLLLLAYSIVVLFRALPLYDFLKIRQLEPMQNVGKTIGRQFDFDPVLGAVLAANAQGFALIPKGSPVPFHHDDDGVRAPLGVPHMFRGDKHPRLLFLGDSFTYGQLLAAEDTFAYKAGLKLGGESVNAGVPGYGLAQMVLQARKMIPKYRPDYVIVQYSPWLVTRAQTEFATDTFGTVMAPYFYDDKEGVSIAGAPFTLPARLLPLIEEYKASPPSLHDKVSFLARFAFPLFWHRDVHLAALRIRQWLGLVPEPSQRPDAIVRAAYAEIDRIAGQSGAKTVVLTLGSSTLLDVPEQLFPSGIAAVPGWSIMVGLLNPRTPDEYVRQYFFWRGSPPEPVDWHPNEHAHEVIAVAVADRIRGLDARKSRSPSLPAYLLREPALERAVNGR